MLRRITRSVGQLQKGTDGQEYKYTAVPMDENHPHYMPHMVLST